MVKQGAVWLIGMNNPYQAVEDLAADPDPAATAKFALYPAPDGSAGWRLYRVLEMRRREYLRTFERRNLLQDARWSVRRARLGAAAVLREFTEARGHALVLCGEKVAEAFGLDFRTHLLTPSSWSQGCDLGKTAVVLLAGTGTEVLVIPHPSGLSRGWNDPDVVRQVRDLVRGLVAEAAEAARGCDEHVIDEHGKAVNAAEYALTQALRADVAAARALEASPIYRAFGGGVR